MPVASFLNAEAPDYWFDHEQSHRNMIQGIADSSTVTVALLDPVLDANVPAGWWDSFHAQLHRDFASAFPAVYWPSVVSIADIDLSSGPTAWWAFSNKNLHDLANGVLPTA